LTDNVWGLEFQWIYFYFTKLSVSDLTYGNETRNQSISDILQAAELPFLRKLQDSDKRKVRRVQYEGREWNKSLIKGQIIESQQSTKKSRIPRSTLRMKLLNNESVV